MVFGAFRRTTIPFPLLIVPVSLLVVRVLLVMPLEVTREAILLLAMEWLMETIGRSEDSNGVMVGEVVLELIGPTTMVPVFRDRVPRVRPRRAEELPRVLDITKLILRLPVVVRVLLCKLIKNGPPSAEIRSVIPLLLSEDAEL